ncbi:MAG: rhodanese-like domain-containing protein [Pseudomonadota bacterium]
MKDFSPLPTHTSFVFGRVFFVLAMLFLFPGNNVHGKPLQYITAPEVKNMIENDPKVVVINVLSKIEYDGLRIPGSINIPVIDFPKTKLLPADKSTPLIIYCMGLD